MSSVAGRPDPRRRALARALAGAAVLVLVAGCASIPTSGPVREGRDLRLARAEDGVPFIGQPPAPGADPENIVRGFLQNGADFQNDHEVAREYLTPAARQRWRPQTGTIVYERLARELPMQVSPDGRVTVNVAASGRIDADGTYHRSPPGPPATLDFRLEQSDGEWRIAALPNGLVLSSADVRETYRQVSLYFLAPSGGRLVPDLVLIPELPGLSTKLVSRLLRGPSASLRDAVTTAFPRDTDLEVNSVPVQDGVATVSLDSAALDANDQAREQMSAQLVWTLKQLPGVLKVRIKAGGESLAVSGVAEEQTRDAWPTYDPDRLTADPSAYVARGDGRIGRYLSGSFQPVPGPGGAESPPLRSPAVSLDASRLAAVSTDGQTVYVGGLNANTGFAARIRGAEADLSAPSWDPENNLWVVDRATGTLWYLPNGANSAQEVAVPRLADGSRPTGVAVSRDGAELALLWGSGRSARLMLGAISRVETPDPAVSGGERVSVVALHEPAPELRGVRDVGWADATSLVVLGSLAGAAQAPYYVDTNGYRIDPITTLANAVSITAAPPRDPQKYPLVAGTRDGQVLDFTSARGWRPLGPGTDPAYPG